MLLERVLRNRTGRPSAHSIMRRAASESARTAKPKFVSRRDLPESAGDPAAVSGPAGSQGVAFNLPGGAPGPRTRGETLSIPGRAGQSINYGDASQKLRVVRRTLDVSGQ